MIIIGGVFLIVVASYEGYSIETAMIGDAMFLTASALGAVYLVKLSSRMTHPLPVSSMQVK